MRYLILMAVTAALLSPAAAGALTLPTMPFGDPDPPSLPIVPAPPTPTLPPIAPQPPSGDTGNSSGGVTWPNGCRTVDFYAQQTSFLFHSRIYRFHQVKHWCWRGGVVYDERHAWSFEGSSTACLQTVYPANSWFFAWSAGRPESGHYSEERAHATNCVFHIGDWKEFYPDVKIWAHADGSYDVTTAN